MSKKLWAIHRMIFRKYLEIGSVRELKHVLDDCDVISKVRINPADQRRGGIPIARGALYLMLQNRIYLGEIVHQGKAYPGQHPALVDQVLWDTVQAALAMNRVERKTGQRAQAPSLLAGILYDAKGRRLTPSHALKGRKRFRYYVTQPLNRENRDSVIDGLRVPAFDLESKVTERLLAWLTDSASLIPAIQQQVQTVVAQKAVLDRVAQLITQWPTLSVPQVRGILLQVVRKIIVRETQLDIELRPVGLFAVLEGKSEIPRGHRDQVIGEELMLTLTTTVQLQRCGTSMRMVIEAERAKKPDARLVNLLVKAHAWKEKLMSGRHGGIEAIAREENVTASWLTRVLRLAFLSPEITQSILDGRQPVTLTAMTLIRDTRLAIGWSDQKAQLGLG